MATLPRYQNLGVQYADLPKISTAAQQAQVQGFDVLNRSLDRMTSYFQSQAETEAKKQAKRYAVENPLTDEQIQQAMADPSTLKIKGAGSIFQETYQAYAASQLSADLQLKASQELRGIEQKFINNEIDINSATQLIKDLMDGQSATMNAISPEVSIQHRAAAATLAKTTYNKILDLKQKEIESMYKAEYSVALENLPARLESVIRQNASAVDSDGKRINIEALLDLEVKPFLGATRVFTDGSGDDIVKAAYKIKNEAKIGALSGYLSDRTVSKTPAEMSSKFLTGDFGDLTPIFKSLSQEQKDTVYAKAAQSFTTEYTAIKNAQSLAAEQDKAKAKTIALKVLSGNLSGPEKRKAVLEMVALDYITFQSGEEMLKPKDPPANPRLEFDLLRKISRGALTADELIKESPRLSNSQFVSLGKALINSEDAEAKRTFKTVAGIVEGQQIIGESKIVIYGILDRNYMELRKLENPDGTPKYTPAQARDEAIKKYEKDDVVRKKAEKRATAEKNIRDELKDIAKDIPIEAINFDHPSITGKTNPAQRTRMINQQQIYKDNL